MQNGLKRMFFMVEKNFGTKGKISISYENIMKNMFNGHPCKNVTKYFAYFSIKKTKRNKSYLYIIVKIRL